MIAALQQGTELFGLPVPSNDRSFLMIIVIHIFLSLIAVISGIMAMLKDKNSKGHTWYGRIYFWSICSAFLTVVILAIMRWPHNNHLLVLGTVTAMLVYAGRKFARTKSGQWARLHTICMGGSYILLLTGFYVDNGKNLPLWNQFPQWFFWVFPAIVGIPVVLYVMKRHPLTRIKN
jgi:ABC-type sugar transport system permease subunit